MTGRLFFAAPGIYPEPQTCRPGQDAARSTRLLQQRSLCNGPGHRPSLPNQRLQSINTRLTPRPYLPFTGSGTLARIPDLPPRIFFHPIHYFFLIFLCSVSGFVCDPQHLDTFYTPGKIIRVKNKQAGMQGKSKPLPQKSFPIKFQSVKNTKPNGTPLALLSTQRSAQIRI